MQIQQIGYLKTTNLLGRSDNFQIKNKNQMKHKFSINRLTIAFAILMLAVVFQGCKWKYDGKILKDKDGNLYILEASGYRNESYDLKPLQMSDIDSLLN